MKPSVSQHEARARATVKWAFLQWRGAVDFERRAQDIAALPTVIWKGRTLFSLRCRGEYGRGPHTVNVPESLLWNLIALDAFRCPYHP